MTPHCRARARLITSYCTHHHTFCNPAISPPPPRGLYPQHHTILDTTTCHCVVWHAIWHRNVCANRFRRDIRISHTRRVWMEREREHDLSHDDITLTWCWVSPPPLMLSLFFFLFDTVMGNWRQLTRRVTRELEHLSKWEDEGKRSETNYIPKQTKCMFQKWQMQPWQEFKNRHLERRWLCVVITHSLLRPVSSGASQSLKTLLSKNKITPTYTAYTESEILRQMA